MKRDHYYRRQWPYWDYRDANRTGSYIPSDEGSKWCDPVKECFSDSRFNKSPVESTGLFALGASEMFGKLAHSRRILGGRITLWSGLKDESLQRLAKIYQSLGRKLGNIVCHIWRMFWLLPYNCMRWPPLGPFARNSYSFKLSCQFSHSMA